MRLLRCIAAIALSLPLAADFARACTNFLITRGASSDGSVMITYAADSHSLYGELYHTPAARHLPGATRKVYEWDTGKYLGEIPQPPETFNVVGNINEHQVAIGETTFGGREELVNPEGRIDYGSLMYIALERARTAREAIGIMTGLVEEFGYCSSGESMSIADKNECWFFEIIGKGPGNKGAVWVARRVPDGYISGHANAARIRQFPIDDPENTFYSPDVISFARSQGYFSGVDAEFSFADAYAPLDYGALRFCDSRVWCMFRRAAPAQNIPADWVTGKTGAEPLPLWIKPDRKLSVRDVMELMRDHFEGTELDMTADVGAGPYKLPYRWRPLTWKVGEREYFNERATSTQQTGFSFVSQSRRDLPDPIGGILWFGLDDTYSTVYVPMYCGITRVPPSFAVGGGNFGEFSWDSAFWVFNFVANYSYLRYSDMIADVRRVQAELEGRFLADQPGVDAAATALFRDSPRLAVEYLSDYSVRCGNETLDRWRRLGEHLIWKYLDGNVRDEHGKVKHPGYPPQWHELVARATGDHLLMKSLEDEKAKSAATAAQLAARRGDMAKAITTLLSSRGVELNGEHKAKLDACEDVKQLERWLIRAATAASIRDVLTAD